MTASGRIPGVLLILAFTGATAIHAEDPPKTGTLKERPTEPQATGIRQKYRVELHDGQRFPVPASGQSGRVSMSVPNLVITGPSETVNLGKYWIGIACSEASETLKSHLKVDSGLVVGSTHDNLPASQAGLKRHDIIVSANGKPLNSIPDLIAAVQKVETGELRLSVIRAGEPLEITVHPVERPEDQQNLEVSRPGAAIELPGPAHLPAFGDRVHTLLPNANVLFFEPGYVLPPATDGSQDTVARLPRIAPAIPPGVSITVTRTGDKLAEITVRRGDETWHIDESSITKLPEELRAPVRSMLGQSAPGRIGLLQRWIRQKSDNPDLPATWQPVDRRELEELRRALRKLNEKVDQLQQDEDGDSTESD